MSAGGVLYQSQRFVPEPVLCADDALWIEGDNYRIINEITGEVKSSGRVVTELHVHEEPKE